MTPWEVAGHQTSVGAVTWAYIRRHLTKFPGWVSIFLIIVIGPLLAPGSIRLYCTVLYLSTCYKFWLHFHDACMVVLSAGRLVYELLNSKYLTWSAFNNPMVAGGWASHHISKFDFQWMHPNTCLDSVRLRFHSLLTKDVPYARGEQHFYQ